MYDVVVEKFTFAISSPGEFLFLCGKQWNKPSSPEIMYYRYCYNIFQINLLITLQIFKYIFELKSEQ